ncbi:MAG: hypothetical protein ACLFVQ_04250 [Chitinispirillaceae bacterium]
MKVVGRLLVGLSVLMMMISCTSSEEAAGDRAYSIAKKAQGSQRRTQLKTAYINYRKAVKADPEKVSIKLRNRFLEMCVVRAKLVLDEGNSQMDAIPLLMDDIEDHLTPEVAPELRQQYAAFLVQMADTSSSNEKYDDALRYIDRAIEKASDPAPFKAKRSDVVKKVAEENFEMAKYEYEQGKKDKENTDALIRAEYYTKVALHFDSTFEDAQKLLSDVRKANLGTYSAFVSVIENYSDSVVFDEVDEYDILIAVPAIQKRGANTNAIIHMYNYSYNPLRMKATDFALVDVNGKKYKARASKITPDFLEQEKEMEIRLSFPTPKAKIKKLVYENDPHFSEKFFR